MASSHRERTTTRATFHTDFVIAALAAFVVLFHVAFTPTPAVAVTAADSLSDADKTCLACHSSKGLEKKLANGETLSLHIRGEEFAKSVHRVIGCAACHADIDPGKHPGATKQVGSTREYTVKLAGVCRQCHEDKFKLYEGSIHAALVRSGNAASPVCTNCHGSHTVRPKAAYETISGVPCRNCHAAIFDAYIGSMHGRARSKLGHVNAPICSDCHRAHDVSAASVGNRLRDACLGCHEAAPRAHEKWLPNAKRHLESVSCPACHAPAAQRRIDLRLYDSATQKRVMEQEGLPPIEERARSAEGQKGGLDAMALWSLLREINRERQTRTTLLGRMEVGTGVEAHQLADKTKAVRDCESCHREGADPFQTVTLSIIGPDGRPVRFGARAEVLRSAISVDSVRGFYAVGGTRIKLLDILLAVAVLGGIAVPLVHLLVKSLLRKRPKTGEGEGASEAARVEDRPSPGGRFDAGGDRG